MQPNKVYESLAYLANNIIQNEKMRFELFDKVLFKDQFVRQINNMLALEKDFDQELNGVKWATIFAKALVKITDKKQRFEKPEGRSVEEIYADYSSFIAYTTTTFAVSRAILVADTIKFTEEDILFNAKLTEQIKEQYKTMEAEKTQTEQLQAEQAKNPQPNKPDNNQQNNFYNQPNQNFYGNQQGFGQDMMPVHPLQDPRFYPYNAKPKWMPMLKWIFAIVTIITAIMLIVTSAVMMTTQININSQEYGDALFGPPGPGNPWTGSNWNDFVDTKLLSEFPLKFVLMQSGIASILGFFFYSLPVIYIAYNAFKKPRNLKEKYRISALPVIFMFVLFGMAIFSIYQYLNPNQIENLFARSFTGFMRASTNDFKYTVHFDAFWAVVMKNYGDKINTATTFIDIELGLILASIVFGVVLLIINPKLDRDKVMFAQQEYQKATMAMMQGQRYEMDPRLYENEEDAYQQKASKFSQWWQKTFHPKKKNKDKKDSDK